MTRLFLMYCVVTAGTFALQAVSLPPIPLWPGGSPGDVGSLDAERDTTSAKDNDVAGRRVMRITNVTVPTLTVYRAAKADAAAVLVFPGGGYNILAWDLEGTEVCDWLNSIGVTAVLMKYRVPARDGMPRYSLPLQDAQRAMGMVRAHAGEWGIDERRIGVLGFSAGGHLAAALSANFEKRSYPVVDASDALNCRPDFVVLIYPGGMVDKEKTHLSPELKVLPGAPPTFLAQAEDDGVGVENSMLYYAALKLAKVPAEMHLYPVGGHGYGLRESKNAVTTWPARVAEWMRGNGTIR